jgi:hypothetical protein
LLGPRRHEIGIAEENEWRNIFHIARPPCGERKVGADPGGVAKGERKRKVGSVHDLAPMAEDAAVNLGWDEN